jgi:hypothetical protein
MLRCVALVRNDVSEELSAYSYGYVPISPILVTLMVEAPSSSEASVLTRATRRNIPEDGIVLVHCCLRIAVVHSSQSSVVGPTHPLIQFLPGVGACSCPLASI